MEDWLATFGTFQSNLPAGLGANDYYLPTNRKSLVVSCPNLLPSPWRVPTSWFHWGWSVCFIIIWQVSILSAGTFFGALLSFPMGDMVGRKWGIVVSCMVLSLGVGLQLDTHWATFVIGRVIAGIGVVCIAQFVVLCVTQNLSDPPNVFFLGSRVLFSSNVSIWGIRNDVTLFLFLWLNMIFIVRP